MRVSFTLLAVLIISGISAQTLDYAKKVVKELSSASYYGRGYSNGGINKAADFIENEYSKHGLLKKNNDYRQPFMVDANTFPGTLSLQIGSTEFIVGEDFIIDPASCALKGEFSSVKVLTSDLLNEKKLRELFKSLDNKVLIIDERDLKLENDEKQQLDEILKFVKYGPNHNAVAVVFLTDKKLTWHISPVQALRPVFILKTDKDIPADQKVSIEVDATLKRNVKTSNIIGYHPGKVKPDSMIVFTAHYDHLGQLGANNYIPGANDNASGVALLLSLAKYFNGNPPDYSVVFIATAAEELGLLGAKYFVENPTIDLESIKFLVNFDLAGTGDEGIKVVNGSVYSAEFQLLSRINDEKQYLSAVKKRGEACISDHCMFYMKGVPCFYIYTLGGIKAYHDVYDRYETLPFSEFEDYARLIIDFVNGF